MSNTLKVTVKNTFLEVSDEDSTWELSGRTPFARVKSAPVLVQLANGIDLALGGISDAETDAETSCSSWTSTSAELQSAGPSSEVQTPVDDATSRIEKHQGAAPLLGPKARMRGLTVAIPDLPKRDVRDSTRPNANCASKSTPDACGSAAGGRTTVMLRNLPNNYTRQMLLDLLDERSEGQYNFVYLPIDFATAACLGYAFVNLISEEQAQRLSQSLDGFCDWKVCTRKMCKTSWSDPHQGFEANVERYRNSPVMHETVPQEFKPMVFVDGMAVPFPPPTKRLRAPRVRQFVD